MDFRLTEEQCALKEGYRALGASLALGPKSDAAAIWQRCGEAGLIGLPYDEALGGGGKDLVSLVAAFEGFGHGLRDNGLPFAFSAQMLSVQAPISVFGSDEQKERFLRPLNEGRLIGAHGMTEPHSGSDAFSLSTTATRDGDSYVLDGTKVFCTNAPVAGLFIIFATTSKEDGFMGITGFLVERDTPGLSVSPDWQKLGLHGASMGQVYLDGCRVPAQQRLGREGAGFRIFNESMDWERGLILAQYLGAMQRQIDDLVAEASDDMPQSERYRRRLAVGRMRTRLEVSRMLVYRVAWAKQCGRSSPLLAAESKLAVSQNWLANCEDALSVSSGDSRVQAERDMLDALGPLSYSGTTEIQKNIIMQALERR